jgi:hypothetical protein
MQVPQTRSSRHQQVRSPGRSLLWDQGCQARGTELSNPDKPLGTDGPGHWGRLWDAAEPEKRLKTAKKSPWHPGKSPQKVDSFPLRRGYLGIGLNDMCIDEFRP